MNLIKRPRRLRHDSNIRRLVRETSISFDDLIYPMFIVEGIRVKNEIPSMPGIFHMSIDVYLKELEEVSRLGIPGVLLFGIPSSKDELGSLAYSPEGVVQRAIKEGKKHFPNLLFIADVCLCEYTTNGHCGITSSDGQILNDESVEALVRSALSFAEAGADIIAPSDMMDGRVGAIRKALDENNYLDKIIMAYSVKYASSFYSPFRDAAKSKPMFGDRKSYQMDYCNKIESFREVELDISEGADIIMVKPALAYLDIISEIKNRYPVPIAAYNVSGEYSMIKAAASNGWIDEKSAVLELVTAIKRAGAKLIITYFAKQLADWIRGGN